MVNSNKIIIKKDRNQIIDILRGLAVLLMIWAHVVAFFYLPEKNQSDFNIITWFREVGDTICFTFFVFLSGCSSYYSLSKLKINEKGKTDYKSLFRLLKVILIYYSLAFISQIKNLSFSKMLNIFFLKEVPPYTEFLLAFVLFGIIVLIFQKNFHKLLQKKYLPVHLIGLGLITYIVGTILFKTNTPDSIAFLKSLFFGDKNLIIRFPIFQYFIVLLLGLYTGKALKEGEINTKKTYNYLTFAAIFCGLILVLSLVSNNIAKFPYDNKFGRWPPTLSFLSIGLLTLYLLLLSIFRIQKSKYLKTLAFIGNNALKYFWWHTAIIFLINIYKPFKTDNSIYIVTIYLGIIGLISIVTKINQSKFI